MCVSLVPYNDSCETLTHETATAKMRAAVGSWLAAAVDAALRDAGEARTILVSVIEVQPPAGVKPALCEEVLTTLFGASATPTEAGAVLVATPGARHTFFFW